MPNKQDIIKRIAVNMIYIILGLALAFGLYHFRSSSVDLTTKMVEEKQDQSFVPDPIGVDAEDKSPQKQHQERRAPFSENQTAPLQSDEPLPLEGKMTMAPSDQLIGDEGEASINNCYTDNLEGKLLVEYDGQIIKDQRVPPDGSVSYTTLKKIRDNLRIVNPGEMVTMEYNPQRLTIELDERGFIENAYCG